MKERDKCWPEKDRERGENRDKWSGRKERSRERACRDCEKNAENKGNNYSSKTFYGTSPWSPMLYLLPPVVV
jgi:hypothetical protein